MEQVIPRRAVRARMAQLFQRPYSRASSTLNEEPAGPGRPRTAFILLGGGARGAAQAGALTVLLRAGVVPDLIVGISAGSWNGAFLAQAPTPERAFALEGLWHATTSNAVLGPHRWRVALNALAHRSSLYGSEGMRRTAEMYLSDVTFEECQVPLLVVATDLVSGTAKVFDSGPLLPAILASSAMPGIFPPRVTASEVLVDGGLAEWQGCLAALEWGATRIVLVACGCIVTPVRRLDTFRRIFERSWEISIRNGFERTVYALRGAGVQVLPIFPQIRGGGVLDFDLAPALVSAGRLAAEQSLAENSDWQAPLADPVYSMLHISRNAVGG